MLRHKSGDGVKRVLLLLILFVCIQLFGCSSGHVYQGASYRAAASDPIYPAGWTTIDKLESCDSFSGFYKGVGETHVYTDHEVFVFKALSVARAIQVGAMGKVIDYMFLEYKPAEEEISGTYYGDKLLPIDQREVSKPKYSKQVSFVKSAACTKGVLELQSSYPWMGNGEGYPHKQEIKSSLFKTTSGELIVKYSSTMWTKKWFGLVTEERKELRWYKFEQIEVKYLK